MLTRQFCCKFRFNNKQNSIFSVHFQSNEGYEDALVHECKFETILFSLNRHGMSQALVQ